MLKEFITKLKSFIVYLLDFIVPKDDHIIIFSSRGGNSFNGHPKSIFNYIKKHHPEYKLYFMMTRHGYSYDIPLEYHLYNNTFKTAFIFLRARFLVGSHFLRDFRPFNFSRRKIYVQTWHGFGTKKTFFAMGNVFDKENQVPKRIIRRMNIASKRITFFISPSELISAIYCRAFNIDSRKMITTGQPATDDLIYGDKKPILNGLYNELPEYNKIILYAPTFRRDPKVTETYPIKYFPFEDMNFDDLDEFLEKNKILILIRDHVTTQNLSKLKRDRILGLNADICQDIYDIFPETDLLITDWSGVSHEFYPLKRPVMHILYDADTYLKDPGIHVDDYSQWTPGYRPTSYNQFKEQVYSALFKEDIFLEARNNVYKQLFPMQDGNSAKRIFELMMKAKNGI